MEHFVKKIDPGLDGGVLTALDLLAGCFEEVVNSIAYTVQYFFYLRKSVTF
jgi:hypothetical protein